jgi:L-amino acid N-acyltransferase YncA
MAGVTTRLAMPDDAPAIARIHNEGIEDRVATFETVPRTVEAVAAGLEDRGDTHPTIVVVREGEVAAWAGASSYRSRPCYDGVAEFSVYVARAYRGTGLGRVAIEALVVACEARGFWKLLSRVFPENLASRALCRSTGFREVGTYHRHARLDGVWRDCVIVERLIGQGSIES